MKATKDFALPWMVITLLLTCPLLAHAQAISLAEAESRLESGNREIMAARQQVELSGSGVILAGAAPNPTLSASTSSITPSRGIGGGRPLDKQVDSIVHLEQLVERGGTNLLDLLGARRTQRALELEAVTAAADFAKARAAWFASQFWDTQTP